MLKNNGGAFCKVEGKSEWVELAKERLYIYILNIFTLNLILVQLLPKEIILIKQTNQKTFIIFKLNISQYKIFLSRESNPVVYKIIVCTL